MRQPIVTTLLAGATLILAAGTATAQACLGLPTRDGQIALAATGLSDGDTRFGAEFTADVTGPAAFRFGYGGVGGDGDEQEFSASAAYEFYLLEPSVCAVAGVLYQDAPGAVVEERLGIPLGFGLGKTLRVGALDATVYGVPQYVWLRDEGPTLLAGEDGAETSNEFMAETGLTLGFDAFYLGGAVIVSTFDDRDPGFRFRAGLFF